MILASFGIARRRRCSRKSDPCCLAHPLKLNLSHRTLFALCRLREATMTPEVRAGAEHALAGDHPARLRHPEPATITTGRGRGQAAYDEMIGLEGGFLE